MNNSVLDSRSKTLDTLMYSYKLPAGANYGLDLSFPEQLEIDENEMSVIIPFASGVRRDGVGDLLEIGGIRTERHQKNPIALFDHGKQVTLPVGLSEDPDTGEYTVYLDPNTKKARGKVFFYQGRDKEQLGNRHNPNYDHAVFCEQLFDLIAKKFIRAGSIGYQIVSARELPPDYETGAPKGMHLLAVTMLELSAVVLPANQDTVTKALSIPKICGKSLSPYLVKSLSCYLPEKKKIQSGYGSKSVPDYIPKTDRVKKGDTIPYDKGNIYISPQIPFKINGATGEHTKDDLAFIIGTENEYGEIPVLDPREAERRKDEKSKIDHTKFLRNIYGSKGITDSRKKVKPNELKKGDEVVIDLNRLTKNSENRQLLQEYVDRGVIEQDSEGNYYQVRKISEPNYNIPAYRLEENRETGERIENPDNMIFVDNDRDDLYKSLRDKYRSKSLMKKEFTILRKSQKSFLNKVEKGINKNRLREALNEANNEENLLLNDAVPSTAAMIEGTGAGAHVIMRPTPGQLKAGTVTDTVGRLVNMREGLRS